MCKVGVIGYGVVGLAGKKIGDDRKYFWFQVRFRGLITLGVWKSAKNIQKLLKLASLRQ